MEEFFGSYFRGDYMPHGHCYLWQPHILWVNVISDLIIAAAYFSIPVALLAFIKSRPDIEHRAVFVLFSAFILLCGLSHLMGIWTIWQGVYGLHGLTKLTTAIVSMITAYSLYKLLPQIVKLPTIEQYEGIVNKWSNSQKENEFLSSQLQSQKLTQFVLDSIPISLLLVDEHGKVILSNSCYNNEFNDSEVLDSIHISELFHGNSADFKREFHQENLFEEIDLGEQTKFLDSVKSGGILVPVEVVITRKEYQQKTAFVITIKDLREITQIKQMLIDSNSRFERAVRATDEGLWEWDLAADKMIWSPKFYSMTGTRLGDEPSLNLWLTHVHRDYREEVKDTLDRHIEFGEKFFVEYVGKNEQGDWGWFAVNGNSMKDINGKPSLLSGSLRYIDEEKQQEEKYNQKNRLLNAIYEGSMHAMWIVKVAESGEMSFSILNDTAVEVVGFERELLLNKPLLSLINNPLPESFIEHIVSRYQNCVDKKQAVEYVEKIELDEPKWFQTTLYPIIDDENRVSMLVGSAIDISSLKNIECQLEENKAFLENLVNNSVAGMYVFDLKEQVNSMINQRYTSILGYRQEDLDKMDNLMELFHPDETDMILAHMAEVAQSKPGDLVPLEYRFKHKDGNWVWCYSIDSVLERDENGVPVQILGTFVDVTEKNRLVSKLKESNEYLERFAFVASHDLQEPLRKISAFSESLSARLQPVIEHDEDSKFEFSRMKLAAKRMSTMIHDLLQLSRINSRHLKREICPFSEIVDEATDLLELAIEEKRAIVSYDDSIGNVLVDKGLMIQLMQNLISNSLKFCKSNEPPVVKIFGQEHENIVDIFVADNGIGINQKHHESIFEPFRRLHVRDDYEGSGIGLAIVNQIVAIHNGTISCESEEGAGLTIKFTLPKG